MSTPEEIKKMSLRFALEKSEGDAYDPFEEEYAAEVLQWLSKDYCIVPKSKVRNEYEKAKSTHDLYTSATCINEMESRAIDHAEGRMCELTTLFGDKCLPDKELNEENFAKSELEHRLEQTSVQVEPKFRKGDKVCFKDSYYKEELHGEIGIIVSVNAESECYVEVDNTVYCARESDLEPYTEPETKDSIASKPEAKELNLCELLKGCEGEEFFSISVGEVMFKAIYDYDDTHKVRTIRKDAVGNEYNVNFHSDGRRNKSGLPDLYPSEDLLKKYPLDTYSAWMEWKESRKPNRWRAEQNKEFYYFLDDMLIINDIVDSYDYFCNNRYNAGNYFRTKEEAQQAAEVVRECLKEFHKDYTQP